MEMVSYVAALVLWRPEQFGALVAGSLIVVTAASLVYTRFATTAAVTTGGGGGAVRAYAAVACSDSIATDTALSLPMVAIATHSSARDGEAPIGGVAAPPSIELQHVHAAVMPTATLSPTAAALMTCRYGTANEDSGRDGGGSRGSLSPTRLPLPSLLSPGTWASRAGGRSGSVASSGVDGERAVLLSPVFAAGVHNDLDA
jgi:hypothetical protein